MNWDRRPVSRPGMGGSPPATAAVDVAVLQELRAIREEISKLAEKVGQAATRDDLDDYVMRREFETHLASHRQVLEGWRGWLPIALSCAALVWIVVGPYVHFGAR